MWATMKRILELIIIVTVSIGVSVDAGSSDPVVTVGQGKLAGRIVESRGGRKYLQFLGIPYARIQQTFLPAIAPKKWVGIRDASKFGLKCLQFDRKAKKVIGAEDCLHLNVYRPQDAPEPLPIMVYIHGGAFLFGSGDQYSPKYFMDHDVILITMNYRLGALGFLNTGDGLSSANLGMKDQVMALRWIRDNIHHFGGDPMKVTLFGDSAGGASVSYHLLSPMSRNLFSGAISQSGTALCPWAHVTEPKTVMKRLGNSLGCPVKNSRHLMACLLNKETSDLIMAQQELAGWDDDPVVPFAPSVEITLPSSPPNSVFLPDDPKVLWSRVDAVNKVPWITGVSAYEGATLYAAVILNNTELTEEFNTNWNRMAPFALGFKDIPHHHNVAATEIHDFYFKGNEVGIQTRENLTNLFSDRNFFGCTRDAGTLHAKAGGKVYMYYFTHEASQSWLNVFGIPKKLGFKSPVHSDIVQYLFAAEPFNELEEGTKEGGFSAKLVNLWTSFAVEGKPTEIWGQSKEWKPIGQAEMAGTTRMRYLQISSRSKVIQEPFTERLDFWNTLPINAVPKQ